MADHSIKLNIGSTFEDEGFKKADQAIKDNTKELNSAKAGLNEVTKAVEEISPATAAATSATKNFINAFVTGGIVGGTINLALQGVAKAVELIGEKMADAKRVAEEYAQILRDKISDGAKAANEAFASFNKTLKDTQSDADAARKAVEAIASNDIKAKVAQIREQAIKDIAATEDESEKKVIQARADQAVAILEHANATKAAAAETESARQKFHDSRALVEKAEDTLAAADQSLADAKEKAVRYLTERNQLEMRLQNIEENYAEQRIGRNAVEEARQTIAVKIKDLEEEYADDIKMLEDAEKARAEAAANLEQAEIANADALNDLNIKVSAENAARAQASESLAKNKAALDESTKALQDAVDNDAQGGSLSDILDKSLKPVEGWIDAPSEEIKPILEKVEQKTSESEKDLNVIRAKQLTANQTVNVTTPKGDLPTIQEIKEQRQAIENAPAKMADEAFKKYGYQTELLLTELNQANGKEARYKVFQKFQDVVTGIQGLPIDVAVEVVKQAASQLMLKKDDWRQCLQDESYIRQWLENGRTTSQLDQIIANTAVAAAKDDDSSGSDPFASLVSTLQNIDTALKDISTKLSNLGLQ